MKVWTCSGAGVLWTKATKFYKHTYRTHAAPLETILAARSYRKVFDSGVVQSRHGNRC